MASSQNEFFVGCLIGGIVGVATVLLVPKKFLNGFGLMQPQQKGNHSHSKGHSTHTTHNHTTAHTAPKGRANHSTHSASKWHTDAKKASTKKTVKEK